MMGDLNSYSLKLGPGNEEMAKVITEYLMNGPDAWRANRIEFSPASGDFRIRYKGMLEHTELGRFLLENYGT